MQCDYCMEARVPGMATLCADVMASFIVSPSIPGLPHIFGESHEMVEYQIDLVWRCGPQLQLFCCLTHAVVGT